MAARLAPLLFSLDPGVRSVAVNQGGAIREMEQRAGYPTLNSHETAEKVGATLAGSSAGAIEQALRLALPRGFQ